MLHPSELLNVATHHKEAPQARKCCAAANILWPVACVEGPIQPNTLNVPKSISVRDLLVTMAVVITVVVVVFTLANGCFPLAISSRILHESPRC